MTFKLLLTIASGLALVSGAQAQEQETQPLDGYALTGETESCLQTRRIDEIKPQDDNIWLFTTKSGQSFQNEVGPGCNRASSIGTYIYYESTGSLCRNDTIEVRERNIEGSMGACSLGDFEELVPLESDDHS